MGCAGNYVCKQVNINYKFFLNTTKSNNKLALSQLTNALHRDSQHTCCTIIVLEMFGETQPVGSYAIGFLMVKKVMSRARQTLVPIVTT